MSSPPLLEYYVFAGLGLSLIAMAVIKPKWVLLIGLFASFFSQTGFGPKVFGATVTISDLFFVIVIGETLFRLIQVHARIPKSKNTATTLFGILLVVIAVSGIVGMVRGVELFAVRAEARPLLYYAVFFSALVLYSGNSDPLQIVTVSFVGGAVLGIRGIYLSLFGDYFTSYLVNTNLIAIRRMDTLFSTAFAMHMSIFGIAYLSQMQTRLATIRTRLLVCFFVICLFLTLTRGFWVGFAGGFLYMMVLLGKELRGRRRAISLLLVLCVAISLGITFYAPVATEVLANRFSGFLSPTSDLDAFARLYESEIVVGKILENPIFGYGLGSEFIHDPEFDELTPLLYGSSYINPRYIHDVYLWLWFKMGILGVVVFGSISIANFINAHRLWRGSGQLERSFGLGFGGYNMAVLLSQLTSPLWNNINETWLFAMLSAVAVLMVRKIETRRLEERNVGSGRCETSASRNGRPQPDLNARTPEVFR